jgi:hypothetical protein
MALKLIQLQVTTIKPQANAITESLHKDVNDMLRSFDLKNNHENLEQQEDYPYDYFLQSTAWANRSKYHRTLQEILCRFVDPILEIN